MKTKGFTLLETMIAMMIIVGAIIIVTSAWSGNFLRMRKASSLQEISHLLERKMVELDVKYRDHFNDIQETEAGDFGSDYKNYRWEVKSRDFEMPDISGILATQTNGKGQTGVDEMTLMMVQQMSDYFKSAVKELTLTVYGKTGRKKEMSYSLTTYFIDFNKEVSLPGGGAPSAPAPSTPSKGVGQ